MTAAVLVWAEGKEREKKHNNHQPRRYFFYSGSNQKRNLTGAGFSLFFGTCVNFFGKRKEALCKKKQGA